MQVLTMTPLVMAVIAVGARGLGDAQAQGDLTTDGEIAAVHTRGGRATGAVLIHGTRLKSKGKTMIERATKVDCAEVAL